MVLRNANLLGMQTQSIYWCLLGLPSNPALPARQPVAKFTKTDGAVPAIPGLFDYYEKN